jgi:4-hydroxy-2-oxoheptanedioate aldolase
MILGRASTPFRSLMLATAAAAAVCATLTVEPAAQGTAQPKPRLNQIIEQVEQGMPAFGGKHWRLIEMEHSPYVITEVVRILKELRPEGSPRPTLTPIVRIPLEGDEVVKSTIKQLLDSGVMGVVVPHVETKEQVMNVVKAMRYPPQRGAKYPEPKGLRGWGSAPAALWRVSPNEYVARADVWPLNPEGELLAIVMIESREGIKNLDSILQVPGLGAVLIGPSDLSMSLGVGTPSANPNAPEVEAATAAIAKACVAHKVLCGSFGSPDVKARLAQGFRLFTGGGGNYQQPLKQ